MGFPGISPLRKLHVRQSWCGRIDHHVGMTTLADETLFDPSKVEQGQLVRRPLDRGGLRASRRPRAGLGSIDSLGQGDDDPFWPAYGGHAPDVFVLANAADQAIAVLCQPFDDRLQIIHFEHHAA